MLEWVARYRLNEYADLLGLLVSIIGFSLTLVTVWRSRGVASEALLVANKVRDDLRKVETVATFSAAIAAMEEIKRLHRKGELEALPERYSQLRRSLIGLKASSSLLTNEEQALLQGAVAQFAAFERQIERCLAGADSTKINFPKMNKTVSNSIDQIHALVVRLKLLVGDGS